MGELSITNRYPESFLNADSKQARDKMRSVLRKQVAKCTLTISESNKYIITKNGINLKELFG